MLISIYTDQLNKAMKKIDSDKLVGIILRISLCLALVLVITACANIKADPRTAGTNTSISKEQESDVDGEQTTKGNNSIANVKSMADVIGCVFAPAECQEKKDLGSTEDQKGDGNNRSN